MKKARTVTEAKKELGRRVASARQDAGLTQVQLSDAIEKRFKKEDIRLSVRSIEEIEAGRANPSFEKLYVIADRTGTSIFNLVS